MIFKKKKSDLGGLKRKFYRRGKKLKKKILVIKKKFFFDFFKSNVYFEKIRYFNDNASNAFLVTLNFEFLCRL